MLLKFSPLRPDTNRDRKKEKRGKSDETNTSAATFYYLFWLKSLSPFLWFPFLAQLTRSEEQQQLLRGKSMSIALGLGWNTKNTRNFSSLPRLLCLNQKSFVAEKSKLKRRLWAGRGEWDEREHKSPTRGGGKCRAKRKVRWGKGESMSYLNFPLSSPTPMLLLLLLRTLRVFFFVQTGAELLCVITLAALLWGSQISTPW